MTLSRNTAQVVAALGGALIGALGTIGATWIQARHDNRVPIPAQTSVSADAKNGEWKVQSKVDQWDWGTDWINSECQPRDLSGILVLSLQKGNSAPYSFFVLCRADRVAATRYAIRMTPKSDDTLESIKVVLRNPNAKLGPYYFSSDGHGGAFWYVEKAE